MKVSSLRCGIAIMCATGLFSTAAATRAAFIAYDDCAWTVDSTFSSSANDVTGAFTTNSPLALLSGTLRDVGGTNTSVTVTFTTNAALGLNLLDRALDLPVGSDAETWFANKIGTNSTVNWASGNLQMTFSGMNPSKLYNIVLWSTRGISAASYSNRFTDIVLSGAVGFTNRSSVGVTLSTVSMSNDQTRVRAAMPPGLVVRYDGVNPGPDGAVTFTMTPGADLLWPTAASVTNGYLNAFLVQELDVAGASTQSVAQVTAYNDCAWTANSGQVPSANDATGLFTTNSPWALLNGPLMDSVAATQLAMQVAFTTNGATTLGLLDRAFAIPVGSDAETWFAGKIGTNCAATWAGGNVQMTLSGLDPAQQYNLVLWSTRGADGTQYSNRFTDITISGVGSFVNLSSTGTELGTVSVSNDRTRVRAALAPGLVVRYDNVVPSAGGTATFTLTAGADLLWPTAASGTNGYLNAFLVQNHASTNLSPPFVIQGAQWVGGSNVFHLTANGIAGRIYRVMQRDSMATGAWQQWALQTSLISTVTVDLPVNAAQKYFQLVETSFAVPSVNNSSGASSVGATTATLNGSLSSTGGWPTTAYICWDTSDKGSGSTSAWAHVDTIGVRAVGNFSEPISGLASNTSYAYRCLAINSAGSSFASSAAGFTTATPVLPPSAFYQIYAAYAEHFATDPTNRNNANFASTYVFVSDPVAGNHTPTITSVTANPPTVSAMSNVNLSVSATDTDGDPLQYFWVAPAGQLGWSRASNETWRAASVGATYTLQVMVGDGKAWTSSYVNVQVTGNGFDDPNAQHLPTLTSVKASATTVAPGQTINLSLTAYDRDPATNAGDYHDGSWGASGGTVTGSTTNGATWTAPASINTATNRPTKPGYVLWPRLAPDQASCPIPLSTDFVAVAMVGRVSHQHWADTWMPCWAADGSMYSAWQDGNLITPAFRSLYVQGYGGGGLSSNGWAKIRGDDPMDLAVTDAGVLTSSRGSAWAGRYPNAVFHKDGVLYYGTRLTTNNNTMYPAGPNVGFHYRPDGGSWTISPFDQNSYLFGNQDAPAGQNQLTRLGQTYLVDYGQNQSRSPDGKVYFVSAGTPGANAGTPHDVADDAVYLCRVTASPVNINNSAAYEVYAGNGIWTNAISAAQPILVWSNHISSATIVFNPGLNRYIMSCEKATTHSPDPPVGNFDFFILESSSLTGPYKMIQYWSEFGKQGYYPNIPSKFISADGKGAWLWYGANFWPVTPVEDPFGAGYRLVEQEIRFLTPAEIAATP